MVVFLTLCWLQLNGLPNSPKSVNLGAVARQTQCEAAQQRYEAQPDQAAEADIRPR